MNGYPNYYGVPITQSAVPNPITDPSGFSRWIQSNNTSTTASTSLQGITINTTLQWPFYWDTNMSINNLSIRTIPGTSKVKLNNNEIDISSLRNGEEQTVNIDNNRIIVKRIDDSNVQIYTPTQSGGRPRRKVPMKSHYSKSK